MNLDKEAEKRSITVADFVERSDARLRCIRHSPNETFERHFLDSPRVQKLGLALSGFAGRIHRGRIQIYGNSERSYIERLNPDEVATAFSRLDRTNISCVLVTAGIEPTPELLEFAKANQIPLLSTATPSSESIAAIADILAESLAPSATIHGVLMEVFGIGVLIVGDSGIGKSECALDLITRGHRLISDDSVHIKRVGDRLYGTPPENIRDYLEIRGLGIINARDLFGVSALSPSAEIRFCIEFSGISDAHSHDRLGLEPSSFEVLGMAVPKYPLPVMPGRNLATLVEAAVRVFVSRQSGPNAVEELINGHNVAMAKAREARN